MALDLVLSAIHRPVNNYQYHVEAFVGGIGYYV